MTLLYYKCPCGKFHDITWEQYKIVLANKKDCNCDLIAEIISKDS